ncbi:plant expansin [Mycena floridula]|nr:plant expansin [Mycena floridula]
MLFLKTFAVLGFFLLSTAAPIRLRRRDPQDMQTGDGTYYITGLGACGFTSAGTDMIAAVSHEFFDAYANPEPGNPNKSEICNKKVQVSFQGKSIEVAIVDRCGGCTGSTDLDFSSTAFQALAPDGTLNLGRLQGITWQIIS